MIKALHQRSANFARIVSFMNHLRRALLFILLLVFAFSLAIPVAFSQDTIPKEVEADDEYTIAFLLPFNGNKVFIRDLEQSDFFFPEETQIAVEFYQGALLAIDSLKKLGLKATILVYDVGSDSATITHVLAKPQLRDADLIIGPLMGYSLKATSIFCRDKYIPLISPLFASYGSSTPNEFFILANATIRTHCERIYDYLLQHELARRVIMFYRKNDQDSELVKYIKDYRDKQTLMKSLEVKIIEIKDSSKTAYRTLHDSLFSIGKNIVIIPSNDESFVRSVMRRLTNFSAEYTIEVIGMPTWLNFDLIPAENFDSTRTIVTSSYWLDRSSAKAENFKILYTGKYKVNPTEYSVYGFDEVFYFLAHLKQMGNKFLSVFPPSIGSMIATNFRVVPVLRDERDVMYRENKSVFVLQHQNGTWNRIE